MASYDIDFAYSAALTATLTRIATVAGEIDATAGLPASLLADLEQAGCFDLLTPVDLGGRYTPLPDVLAVYERIARVDGSVGLRVWNGNFGFLGDLLGNDGRNELWRDRNRPRFANAGQPGRAHRILGGWRIEGSWPLVTGADTADWFVFGALVETGELAGTVLRVLLRSEQVEVHGEWHGAGLRGAGNREVIATAAEVPDRLVSIMQPAPGITTGRSFAPLLLVAPGISAVTLGIGRAALDLAAERLGRDADRADDPVRRMRLARSDAALRGALSGLLTATEAVEVHRLRDEPVTDADQARVMASMSYAAEVTSDALAAAASIAGSSALLPGSPLERRLRDGAMTLLHGNQSDTRYPAAGRGLIAEFAPTESE